MWAAGPTDHSQAVASSDTQLQEVGTYAVGHFLTIINRKGSPPSPIPPVEGPGIGIAQGLVPREIKKPMEVHTDLFWCRTMALFQEEVIFWAHRLLSAGRVRLLFATPLALGASPT